MIGAALVAIGVAGIFAGFCYLMAVVFVGIDSEDMSRRPRRDDERDPAALFRRSVLCVAAGAFALALLATL